MKRGFTLLELLVVIGIMAMMGAVTIAGYRQMKRGMEERSVMQNANQFIRSAYQRAQIDRQPVSIYFWNELLREQTDKTSQIVVGRAVAVRRAGRLTKVEGSYLYDEFGDLRFNSKMLNYDENSGATGSSSSQSAGITFYKLNGNETSVRKAIVKEMTVESVLSERLLLSGEPKEFKFYAFERLEGESDWKAGDAYGFEFAEITLPHGYIFGDDAPTRFSEDQEIVKVLNFKVSANSGDGAMSGIDGDPTVTVSSMRPDNSGKMSAHKVGKTQDPTKDLD